jgi:membrane protein YdbS with pleckstrin-like domain
MSPDLDKSALLKQVKHGRNITWQQYVIVLFIGVLSTAIFDAMTRVFMGTKNPDLVHDALVMLYVFTIAVFIIIYRHFNQRINDLIDLIGEGNLTRPKE